MPTYDIVARFKQDYKALTEANRRAFKAAIKKFVDDLDSKRSPRAGLRVKRVQGTVGIFEMTWAPDGRATFQYGEEVKPGAPHIVWRRIGTHDILGDP